VLHTFHFQYYTLYLHGHKGTSHNRCLKTITSLFSSDLDPNDLTDEKRFDTQIVCKSLRYCGKSDDFPCQTWNCFTQEKKKLFPETTDNHTNKKTAAAS